MLKPKEKTNIVTGLFGRYAVVRIKNVQKYDEDYKTPAYKTLDKSIVLVSNYSGDQYIRFSYYNGRKWYSCYNAITNENDDFILYPSSPSNKNNNEDILIILPVIDYKIMYDDCVKAIEDNIEKSRKTICNVSGLLIDTVGKLHFYVIDDWKVSLIYPVNDYEIEILGEYKWLK